MRQWHYLSNGQSVGPVDEQYLQQLVASGHVAASDLVWCAGMAEWQPASMFPELSAPVAPPTYAQTPQAGAAGYDAGTLPYGVSYYSPAVGAINAGFWLRFCAIFLDSLIIGVPLYVIQLVVQYAMLSPGSTDPAVAEGIVILFSLVDIVVYWLYFAIQESSVTQATLGKRALGIYVTNLNGGRISFANATGRYFAKILSYLICYVGFIMAGFTQRKQGLHDMIASTLVVRGKPM